MSIANKTRALLNRTERKPADLSECLGISVQAVRNKFSRGSFSISDLLKISQFVYLYLLTISNLYSLYLYRE